MKYDSAYSGRIEHLPVVVSVLGAPGADMKLLEAVRITLENYGRITAVATGHKMGFAQKYVTRIMG